MSIVSELKDDASDLHKEFYGPRSLFVEERSSTSDAETTFMTDDEDGYYYHSIKCWHEELNCYVTSTRWLYGSESDFSAGYLATKDDGSVVTKEKWEYDAALKFMQRISDGSFDGTYINEISYVDADYRDSALINNYELTGFSVDGDGTFTMEHRYVIADSGPYSICVKAEGGLPTEISSLHYDNAADDEIANEQTMKFHFGSDIQKIYPELGDEGSVASISSN